MDKTIEKIVPLLGDTEPSRRLAAAIVLGELAPADAAVAQALGAALGSADETLTRELVHALGQTRSKAAFPYLLPLLLNAPPATRDAAGVALANLKMDVEAELERIWAKATPEQKRTLVEVFARLHRTAATRFLLEGLFDPDFEMVKTICGAIRRNITSATDEERKELFKQIDTFLKTARVKKDMRATTSCLILLGSLGNPAARPTLLEYISPKLVPFVRRNALQALSGLGNEGAGIDSVVKKLLPLLREQDTENIVSPVVAVLAPLKFPDSAVADLQKLTETGNAEVRRFAVRKLGYLPGKNVVSQMLEWLGDADDQIRDIAARALCHLEDATKPLLDKLAKAAQADETWRLAKLLKPHAERLSSAAKKKLAERSFELIEKNDPRTEPYIWLLRNIDASGYNAQLAAAGEEFRQVKKFAAAVHSLRMLANTELFTPQVRYQLSFSGLKASPKEISPARRAEDPCLRGFGLLLRDPSPQLFQWLLKDKKLLTPEDLFYVGFHFAESTLGYERDFSRQVFELLIKSWPKSEQAKAAKNKLKTEASSS